VKKLPNNPGKTFWGSIRKLKSWWAFKANIKLLHHLNIKFKIQIFLVCWFIKNNYKMKHILVWGFHFNEKLFKKFKLFNDCILCRNWIYKLFLVFGSIFLKKEINFHSSRTMMVISQGNLLRCHTPIPIRVVENCKELWGIWKAAAQEESNDPEKIWSHIELLTVFLKLVCRIFSFQEIYNYFFEWEKRRRLTKFCNANFCGYLIKKYWLRFNGNKRITKSRIKWKSMARRNFLI
jgi:hypothetical protein